MKQHITEADKAELFWFDSLSAWTECQYTFFCTQC